MLTTNNNIIKDQLVEEQATHKELALTEPIIENSHINNEVTGLQKSSRLIRSTISSDYIIYFQETDVDIRSKNDQTSFSQAMNI